jgi:hypothetical protein
MSGLVFGKEIAIYPHAIDRYKRTVGIVYVDGALSAPGSLYS